MYSSVYPAAISWTANEWMNEWIGAFTVCRCVCRCINIKYEKTETDCFVLLCWSLQGAKLSWWWPPPLDCDGKTFPSVASQNRFHVQRDGAQWRRWPPIEPCTGRQKDKELYWGRRSDHKWLCSGGSVEVSSPTLTSLRCCVSGRMLHSQCVKEVSVVLRLHRTHWIYACVAFFVCVCFSCFFN